jgi:hypothetical protein
MILGEDSLLYSCLEVPGRPSIRGCLSCPTSADKSSYWGLPLEPVESLHQDLLSLLCIENVRRIIPSRLMGLIYGF